MERPTPITSDHLSRKAAVYGRQSTAVQVERNTGSTEYQRAQADWPLRWGWSPELIERFEDFGLTGAAAEHRPSYQRLREEIRARIVGAVFVSDITRLGRDTKELLDFVRDCNVYNVLVVRDGNVVNLKDTSEWFTTSLFALLSEFDGLNRRDTLHRGRIAKLRAGKAVSAPPAGYISQPDKSWVKDSDPRVRAAVMTVFREFQRCRTLRATVVSLRAMGATIPRQKPGRPVHSTAPAVHTLQDMLRHPAYKGEYQYRRHVDDHTKARSAKGRRRARQALPAEIVVIPNHHEAYVTLAEWEEVQTILRMNRWTPDHGTAGHGRAQIQGLVRCERHHGRLMGPQYKKGKAIGAYSYGCQGDYMIGGSTCIVIPGAPVDAAVAKAVMERLRPPGVAMLREALEGAVLDESAARRRRQSELDRLRSEAADLERALTMLDATSYGSFKRLETRLEQTIREIDRVEGVVSGDRAPTLRAHVEALRELEVLASDLPVIWYAPTTTHRDRKELIRTLVRRVIVERRDRERIELRIEWVDDLQPRRCTVLLARGVRRLIIEGVARGLSVEDIAAQLTALGVATLRGNVWTPRRVRDAMWRMRREGVPRLKPTFNAQAFIAERANLGISPRRIAAELADRRVLTSAGHVWSPRRVSHAIWRLRRAGRVVRRSPATPDREVLSGITSRPSGYSPSNAKGGSNPSVESSNVLASDIGTSGDGA
jgi:DNA invertase Pin-like site-specific DNA recombinase